MERFDWSTHFQLFILTKLEQTTHTIYQSKTMNIHCITEKQLLSRLLYANPVCLLSSPAVAINTQPDDTGPSESTEDVHSSALGSCPNIMTVSWLTPVDNGGGIILCLNSKRHTTRRLRSAETYRFVLNVPVAGMENMVVSIGGCSGDDTNKIETLDIPLCVPGWGSMTYEGEPNKLSGPKKKAYDRYMIARHLPAITPCVAHIVCEVRSITPESNLMLEGDSVVVTAKMLFAYVQAKYWSGKNFIPQDSSVPPYLSFLGTKTFAHVCIAASPDSGLCSPRDVDVDEAALSELSVGINESASQHEGGVQ